MQQREYDQLKVEIHQNREDMGLAAARRTAELIRKIAREKGRVNMIFAAAPSQNEVLKSLRETADIPWEKVNALHMDEYLGLDERAPQRFSNYLQDHIFKFISCGSVHFINTAASQSEEEIRRYSDLLENFPPDIVCMGVGENGHIAFNDPPDADFNDPFFVKEIQLDEKSRIQQVHDGCFAKLDDVPRRALTLTVPALFSGKHLICAVPTKFKAAAVKAMLSEDISPDCPASILRKHEDAVLYLDRESASLI